MDISGIEPEAFRMQSERDTTTPYTLIKIISFLIFTYNSPLFKHHTYYTRTLSHLISIEDADINVFESVGAI